MTRESARTVDRSKGRARKREVPGRVVRLAVVQAPPSPEHRRPATRGECEDMPRPCPFVGCRYHLALDVLKSGSLKLNFPDLVSADEDGPLELEKLPDTCALDAADRNGMNEDEVAERLNVSRGGVQMMMRPLVRRLRKALRAHTM